MASIKGRRFAHLLQIDAELWARFLQDHESEFSRFEYDVRVGDGTDPGNTFPAHIRTMALSLSMRRIDAIGYAPGKRMLFEITHTAGLKAIGQCLAYPILYRRTFPNSGPIEMMLIAGRLRPDIQPVLSALHIQYLLYPLSESPVQPRSLSSDRSGGRSRERVVEGRKPESRRKERVLRVKESMIEHSKRLNCVDLRRV